MAITLALLLVMLAVTWMVANARPQPVKVRRNLTPQEIAALRRQETDRV
jgi:hypothetical protein